MWMSQAHATSLIDGPTEAPRAGARLQDGFPLGYTRPEAASPPRDDFGHFPFLPPPCSRKKRWSLNSAYTGLPQGSLCPSLETGDLEEAARNRDIPHRRETKEN